jgi:hypothetical protein
MGAYINIDHIGFKCARNGEYVDKSDLITAINSSLCTERQFSCFSRCRRLEMSMAAKMLWAYYDKSCDSRSLFADLVLIPRKNVSASVIIFELKCDEALRLLSNKSERGTIAQKLVQETVNILLFGINFNKNVEGTSFYH